MPFPTIPTFEKKRKHLIVLKKGTTIFGQIQSFTINETISVTDDMRISDTTVYNTRDNKNSTLNITLYLQDDMSEFAALMGGTSLPTAGGWTGTETIKLDPDATKSNLTIEMYDNDTSAAALQGYWSISSFAPTTNNMTVGNAGGALVTTIDGICDDIEYLPQAGVGA